MIKIFMSGKTADTLVSNCEKGMRILQALRLDNKISVQDYQTILDALCVANVYTKTSMEFKNEPAALL